VSPPNAISRGFTLFITQPACDQLDQLAIHNCLFQCQEFVAVPRTLPACINAPQKCGAASQALFRCHFPPHVNMPQYHRQETGDTAYPGAVPMG
jgi:hypothetical protein